MLHLHLPTPKQQPLRHALDALAGLTCELPAIGGNCIEVPAGGYHLPTPIPKQVSPGKRRAVDDFNGVPELSACLPELPGVTNLPQLSGMLSKTMPLPELEALHGTPSKANVANTRYLPDAPDTPPKPCTPVHSSVRVCLNDERHRQ